MFHFFHLIFLPFFVVFHVAGILFLLVMAAVLVKALRRRGGACGSSATTSSAGSGNDAFDEYRRSTLRKLEREADEFRKYLDQLRKAADAAAFDAFLKSRRAGGDPA